MSGRRIAAIGLVFGAGAGAAIVVWLFLSRPPPLPPPEHPASMPVPATETPPPRVATASPPFVARRRNPPPPPYLPPYEKPQGPLLVDLLRPDMRNVEVHTFPRLFGRVVSSSDAAPIRDAVVGVPNEFESGREFEKYVLDVDDVRAVARTDGEGRFELAESVVGSAMMVSAAGFGPELIDRAWLAPAHDAPFVIELAPVAELEARVTDRVGSPKAGIEIRLITNAIGTVLRGKLPHEGTLLQLIGAHRMTDENGKATFPQLPADVSFDAELWSAQTLLIRDPEELVLEGGKTISREWRLGAGATVTGRVLDELEHPVDGQTLWLTQRGLFGTSTTRRSWLRWTSSDEVVKKTRTDAEGRFTIEDVLPGRWWLGVEPETSRFIHPMAVDQHAIAPVAEAFEVESQGGAVDLLLRVRRGLYILGTAVDCNGQPVLAGVCASTKSDDSFFEAYASTDERTGQFVLGPLEPGEYSIRADPFTMKWDRDRNPVFGRPLRPIEALVVSAGREDVLLEFESGASIGVKAIRADTGVDTAASFYLISAERPSEWIMTESRSSRSATFHSIAPGDYALSAVTSDGRTGCLPDLHLVEGQCLQDVVVRVDPGAWLKLTYVGTGQDYAQVKIRVGATVYGADGIKKKTSSTFVAPAGPVTVRWTAGEDHFEEKVELSVGETREIVWPRAKEETPTDQGH